MDDGKVPGQTAGNQKERLLFVIICVKTEWV